MFDKNYVHRTVNHDLHFVDPKTGVHINTKESLWRSAKQKIKKMNRISRKYLQSNLDEYIWRKKCRKLLPITLMETNWDFQSLSIRVIFKSLRYNLYRFDCFDKILDVISAVKPPFPASIEDM
ncbi:unnamed protein product [Brachionus calyciflorus]|uniref:Uncharacterized protein n=1 Tax=Brachionus calyciflorus TaxID=104777 RepID=A0A813YVR4_9BILA|nr:unnamed protein product [Brachionus calyciflorus]